MNICKLLKPKSVAVVGASEKMGMGRDTCLNIMSYQNDLSRVYFVHPKYETVLGRKCYPTVSDVPDTLDLVILCTGRRNAESLLREAAGKGCGGAVIYASGFSETGGDKGADYESGLISAARELDIAVMGPNCSGFINFSDGIPAFAFEGNYHGKTGGIGLVSQSGQFCIDMMNAAEVKLSYAISAGNGKIVTIEDYISFLVDDEDTKVIALYIEGIQNAARLEAGLRRAAQKRKPVVILKAGRSPEGAANASTHTGSMTGDDSIYDALFRKFGVIRVQDLQELRTTAALFAAIGKIPDRANFGAMCMSGGETGICADSGWLHGIRYQALRPKTLEKLKKLLPFYATPRNPLDMTVTLSYDADLFAEGILTFMDDPGIDIGILGYTITEKKPTEPEFIMFEGIKKASERLKKKPLVILPFVEGSRYPSFVETFIGMGIPVLAAPKYGFPALRHLADFIGYKPSERRLALAPPRKKQLNAKPLSEYDSRSILLQAGVDIYLGELAHSVEEAEALAEQIGYPAVLKINSADIRHKSDAGCVKLNLANAAAARCAYKQIMKNAKKLNAHTDGVLVQKMFTGGLEMILGVKRDKQLGPIMLAGLGGVFVELFRDAALYPAPLNRAEAKNMLRSLRAWPLLEGYRGGKTRDVEALADLMVALSDFACDNRDRLEELDLNPVLVMEEGRGVQVCDALLVIEQ
ncbi:MAG: acetate--CoA ligase family protein [Oscillospiraceae bacterium]|nr:acetate--CoA ligase family protein [Oscillospiraceae bacterium]